MNKIYKSAGKTLLASILFCGGVSIAASGDDETYRNVTLENRLYLFDGYGSKWGLDAGSDGLWFVANRPVPDTYSAAVKIRNEAAPNTLVVGNNDDDNTTVSSDAGYVGIGTDNPQAKLDVMGVIASKFTGSDSENNHNMLTLESNNGGAGSDVGFSLENKAKDFMWSFRTYAPGKGFAATKIGTGGTEFEVGNLGSTIKTTVVKMGGKIVFESGHLVTASSRSIKTDIKSLDKVAALKAFHQLQPVVYAYKADRDEPVVGFIAEDIPQLVAMPSKKTIDPIEIVAVLTKVMQEQDKIIAQTRDELKTAQKELARLKEIQKRLSRVESLLTNLALDNSAKNKEVISSK